MESLQLHTALHKPDRPCIERPVPRPAATMLKHTCPSSHSLIDLPSSGNEIVACCFPSDLALTRSRNLIGANIFFLLCIHFFINPLVFPNFRSLFDHNADWLGNDIADPLHGWSAEAVLSSGANYGVPKADWYGSLFYHVKAQFIEFARRVRDMDITIYVTAYDARDLAKMIAVDGLFPSFEGGFDRIDTSNLADHNHLGISTVVKDWGKLLRQTNPRATLSLQFTNWGFQQNSLSPDIDQFTDATFVYAFNTAMLSYVRNCFVLECIAVDEYSIFNRADRKSLLDAHVSSQFLAQVYSTTIVWLLKNISRSKDWNALLKELALCGN